VPHQQEDRKWTVQPTAKNGWNWNQASINAFRWMSMLSEKARVNSNSPLQQQFTLFWA
jgi:hypothetical protein